MARSAFVVPTLLLALAGCEYHDPVVVPSDRGGGAEPAPPRSLEGWYYARAVHLSWELHPLWDGEPFRVYGKRTTDADYFLVAEVTNCTGGVCSYTDVNLRPATTYVYYVAAVGPSGVETASEHAVEVFVPEPVPPRVPGGIDALALDGAAYLRWGARARDADDFSHYRVYLEVPDEAPFLLGETDSEGFLDERAANGTTYGYFVSAVDDQGHESEGGPVALATPRPDYHGEWVWAYEDRPGDSGFRFQADEGADPLVHGDDPTRHFRIEVDGSGWWLVPGPSAEVNVDAFATTALRCGPGADADCVELATAPTEGYTTAAIGLLPQTTYVLRVRGTDGARRYGAVRVELLGSDQNGHAIVIFDWAYQLQPENPSLTPRREGIRLRPR